MPDEQVVDRLTRCSPLATSGVAWVGYNIVLLVRIVSMFVSMFPLILIQAFQNGFI